MNDRYLYRAKRTDNEEWIIGYLYRLSENHPPFIMLSDRYGESHEVDPSTICQCTGLEDENRNMIFENDIVELYDRNNDFSWKAVIKFGNPNSEYTWGWQLEPIGNCEVNTDILLWVDMEESGAFCDVIGSAIDNPELMEV